MMVRNKAIPANAAMYLIIAHGYKEILRRRNAEPRSHVWLCHQYATVLYPNATNKKRHRSLFFFVIPLGMNLFLQKPWQ